ncbi:hypothetical protein FVW59_05115 [Parahaliea aestuarii]|uniref:DUF2157 domain-containing protein n=1 Tax=Parahaliea aestuarii TaxID=1852021 RepID=A0A5C8ZYG0_9GAMM|nr:hypothetical protein FVW59_05115 [Parahaliea aestuarii]
MALLLLLLILLLIGGGIWAWPLLAAALGLSSVTDKAGALRHIGQLMRTYDISPAEVETAHRAALGAGNLPGKRSRGEIARTLFTYLGAIFIVAGVGTYLGSFWDAMGSIMRVLVTLGTGYVLLMVLLAALHRDRYPGLILPLTLASAVITTCGWYVFLDELLPQSDDWRGATLFVCGVMAIQQCVLLAKYGRTVLAFTTLLYLYGFMQVGLDKLGIDIAYIAIVLGASLFLIATALEKTAHRILAEPALLIGLCWLNSGLFDRIAVATASHWAALLVGVSVMLAAYGLSGRYPRLTALGYFVGSVMAYAGLFDLVEGTPVELVYLAVTAAALYGCVALESRALLLTTVIAMLGFIGYFSAEHFADSLGWPVTLMLMGCAFLGVGALALRVKRRI